MAAHFPFYINTANVIIGFLAITFPHSGQSRGAMPMNPIFRAGRAGCPGNATINDTAGTSETYQYLAANCRPNELGALRGLCQDTMNTNCRNGCNDRSDSPTSNNIYCYCDSKCLVYGDCCEDFHEYCPQQKAAYDERLASQFKGVDIICISGHNAFVNNCGTNKRIRTETETEENDSFFHLLSLGVTDSLTGIHFINYTVFKCHQRQGSTAMFWNKKTTMSDFEGVGIYTSDGFRTDSLQYPPDGIKSRDCSRIRITCVNELEGTCCDTIWIDTDRLCNSIQYEHIDEIVPRNGSDEHASQYAHHIFEHGSGGANFTNYPESEEGDDDDSGSEIDETNANRTCFESNYKGRSSLFSVLVSVNPDLTLSLVSLAYLPWREARCMGAVDRNHCHIVTCTPFYYKMGQSCMRVQSIQVTFNYRTTEPKMNIINKCIADGVANTHAAWAVLDNNFVYDLMPSWDGRLSSFNVTVDTLILNNTVPDRVEHLPFIYGFLESPDIVFRHKKYILTQISVTTLMETITELGEMRFSAPAAYETFIDVTYPSSLTSGRDWEIESNYDKIGLLSRDSNLMSNDGKTRNLLVVKNLVIFVPFVWLLRSVL